MLRLILSSHPNLWSVMVRFPLWTTTKVGIKFVLQNKIATFFWQENVTNIFCIKFFLTKSKFWQKNLWQKEICDKKTRENLYQQFLVPKTNCDKKIAGQNKFVTKNNEEKRIMTKHSATIQFWRIFFVTIQNSWQFFFF